MNNFHTHTYRCLHAYGSEEDYVLSAIKRGTQQLGFSDHAPFPDRDFGLRMSYDELDDYLQTIERLSQVYDGTIRLYKGLEIEFYQEYIDYYRMLLDEKQLDYLALGAHTRFDDKGALKNIFFAESTEDYIAYAENICQAIETGLFRFVAHPDLFFLNDFPIDHNAEKACRMILDSAVSHDMILEYNANGYRRSRRMYADGLRHPYPHQLFWKMAADTSVRVIVGSDCHSPDQVCDDAVKDACRDAQNMGLNLIESIFQDT